MPSQKESFLDRFLVIAGKIFLTPFQILISLLGFFLVAAKVIFTFLGALVALVILIIALFLNHACDVKITPVLEDNTVIEITLAGSISEMPQQQPWRKLLDITSLSMPEVLQIFSSIEKDEAVTGVLIRLDQMMLAPAQVEEIRDALKKLKKKGKKILAYADTLEGMSNKGTLAYYLACACDEIWMQPTGQLEMQGLLLEVPFVKEGLEKIGVKPLFRQRYEYKTAPDTFMENKFTTPHRNSLQALLDSFNQLILKAIMEERELTEAQAQNAIDKAPWIDQDAHRLGLVDRLAYNDEIETFFTEKDKKKPKFLSADAYLKHITFAGSSHQLRHKLRSAKQMINMDNDALSPATFAIIYAEGDIINDIKGDNSFRSQSHIGGHQIAEALRQARDNADVQAILLRINTPGGSASGSEIIRREIEKTILSGKKVVVSMGSVCASGGYWVASSASKIVAEPSTITGSIGVFWGKFNTTGLWEKLGIFWDEVHQGKNAMMYSQTQDFTPYSSKNLDHSLDYVYDLFIQRVVEGRKLTDVHVREVAKGRVWSGIDAHKFGLVDELGGLEKAVEVALKELKLDIETPVTMITYPEPLSFTAQLSQLWSMDIKMALKGMTEIASHFNKFWTMLEANGLSNALSSENHFQLRAMNAD